MKNLHSAELTTVVGGITKKTTNDLTLQLTTLQATLKDAATANNNGGGNLNMITLMMMAMAMRPAPAVVAQGPDVAAAPSAVVNIRTRCRR
jgi:hypothetical protein